MRARLAAGLVIAALVLATVAAAQVAPLLPAPALVDVVLHRAEWLPLEPLTLEDLLRTVVGVTIARTGAPGSAEILQVAGAQNGRVQLLLDGIPVTEPGLEWPRLQGLQVSDIDSVEVSRTSDPARIAIWTRHDETPYPDVDLDLGRGDFETRTRRIAFFTPPRAVDVNISYEELLRRDEDFRTQPGLDAVPGLGSYSGRGVNVRVRMHRGADRVRLEYRAFEDVATGSVFGAQDELAAHLTSTALRWQREIRGAALAVDVGQQSWRWQAPASVPLGQSTEGRTHAAVDVRWPAARGWSTWLRLRYANASGDRIAPDSLRVQVGQGDAEVQLHREGAVQCDVQAAAHHDARLGTEWSAATQAVVRHGAWDYVARAGRGISFPGWEETTAPVRRGVHAALRTVWRRGNAEIAATAMAKRCTGGSSAAALLPAAGAGPTSLATTWLEGTWRRVAGVWRGQLAAAGGWTPYWRGDPCGLVTSEARIDVRGGRALFGGDLVVTGIVTARLEGEREFAPQTRVAPAAVADVGMNLQLLERSDLFVSCRNVTSAVAELAPGVASSPRWWFFGLRVRLLD